ncbi:hypothetical protein HY214_02325 [Candidatus Roizmanbacteria bacterium]|nr:hypothetical protein [Candidatus Roizmanbacteria bacterium]
MNEDLVVAFDVDGILNKGTTLETATLFLRKKFNDKLAHISGDFSKSKEAKEITTMLLVLPWLGEYIKHAVRTMNVEVLEQIADFKESQLKKPNLKTSLIVASGRSSRLTRLTQGKIETAGYGNLFDAYYLRPAGYSSPGWKNHLSDTFFPCHIYVHIDDDPLAGHALLKTTTPGRQKVAYIVNGGLAVNPSLMKRAGVVNPSELHIVRTVAQALSGAANLG